MAANEEEGKKFQNEIWFLLTTRHKKVKTPMLMDVLENPEGHGIKNVYPEMMKVIHRTLRRQGFVADLPDTRMSDRLFKKLHENGKEELL
jgi:hypothetical protein